MLLMGLCMLVPAQRLEKLRRTPEQEQPITLLELVAAVADSARTDAEVVATVHELLKSGKVRLIGNFGTAEVDLAANAGPPLARRDARQA